MSDRPAPEPGWHEDPWGEAPLRWWDGTAWAPATATDADSPAPTGTTASATGARSDPPSSIGFRAVGWALGAFVLSLVASVVLSLAAHAVFRHTDIAWVLGGQFGLWAVLIGACRRYSRRRGTGDFAVDYGLAFEWRDLLRGFGWFWIGAISVGVVESFITDPRFQGTNTELPRHFRGDTVGFVIVAALTVIGAPIIEELFFRGLLLRGLLSKLRERYAVFAQAVVFGLAHVNPLLGLHNLSVFAFATTLGVVLGFMALRYGRLGPGIVTHTTQNLLAMVVVFVGR